MNKKIKVILSICILCVTAQTTNAETVDCSVFERGGNQYFKCLETKIRELESKIEIYKEVESIDIDSIREEIQREIYGPIKIVQGIPAVDVGSIVAHSKSGKIRIECNVVTPNPDTEMIRIAGGDGKETMIFGVFGSVKGKRPDLEQRHNGSETQEVKDCMNLYNKERRKNGESTLCDSAHEWCIVSRRNGGCYVNKEWNDWIERQAKKLSITINNQKRCSLPTS